MHYWDSHRTISNGSCGYHACAGAFTYLAAYRPDLINTLVFEPEHQIFKPFADFLCHKLKIKDFSAQALQKAIHEQSGGLSEQFITTNIAPAIFILSLTHYAVALRPARDQLTAISNDMSNNEKQRQATQIAESIVSQLSPFQTTTQNSAQLFYYSEHLDAVISSQDNNLDDDIVIYESLIRRDSFLQSFIENNLQITTEIAEAFSALIVNAGFKESEFPNMSMFETILNLLCSELRSQNDIPCLPVVVTRQSDLADPTIIKQGFLAAIYHCGNLNHYEYAVAHILLQQVNESCIASDDDEEARSIPAPLFFSSGRHNTLHYIPLINDKPRSDCIIFNEIEPCLALYPQGPSIFTQIILAGMDRFKNQ